jgi:lysophospholipase L1-like esterase
MRLIGKLLLGLSVAMAVTCVVARGDSPVTLKKGDRIAIAGDSITEQKLYCRYMEDYFAACVPQLKLWTVQLGWSGETAAGFVGRMDMDLLSFKPTVVTTCYGMNDGGYTGFSENTGRNYERAMRKLIEKAKAAGARVVVGTPGAVDTKYFSSRCPADVYNDTLLKLGQIDRRLAVEFGMGFADVHAPMIAAMAAAKEKLGQDFPVCGRDGIHPDADGHLVMAYAFLKALGLDGRIGAITLDMDGKAEATDGHKVISFAAGAVEIESERYPFCFTGDEKDPGGTRSITPFVPFNSDLNRLTLTVKNLKAEKAKVTWGTASKSFTRNDLAKGINLAAEFPDNPFCESFRKVDAAVGAKQSFETGLVKQSFHDPALVGKTLARDPEAAAAAKRLLAQLLAKQDALAKSVRDAVVPVRHKITVTAE